MILNIMSANSLVIILWTNLINPQLDGAQMLGVKMVCANLEAASMKGSNFEDPAGSR